MIQHHLKKQIPDLQLEKKIDNRRADAVWEEQKIVFELQLSPISQEEVLARGCDYTSSGYQVVWILHDAEFNQRRLSPAEQFLRVSYPTYFTNGSTFYDQIEVVEGNQRRYRGDLLPVSLSSPCRPLIKVPDRCWPLHCLGDLHTWCATHGVSALQELFKKHRSPQGIRWWLQFATFRILEWASNTAK